MCQTSKIYKLLGEKMQSERINSVIFGYQSSIKRRRAREAENSGKIGPKTHL